MNTKDDKDLKNSKTNTKNYKNHVVDKINFEDLIKEYRIEKKQVFLNYLKEIFIVKILIKLNHRICTQEGILAIEELTQ